MRALRSVVDRARDELLARARLTPNQHARATLGDPADFAQQLTHARVDGEDGALLMISERLVGERENPPYRCPLRPEWAGLDPNTSPSGALDHRAHRLAERHRFGDGALIAMPAEKLRRRRPQRRLETQKSVGFGRRDANPALRIEDPDRACELAKGCDQKRLVAVHPWNVPEPGGCERRRLAKSHNLRARRVSSKPSRKLLQVRDESAVPPQIPQPAKTCIVISLRFASGTLEVRGFDKGAQTVPDACAWDPRASLHRAEAVDYASVVMSLVKSKTPYEDEARDYLDLEEGLRVRREPRPYQSEALTAWRKNRGRGVVVLPTGAGKSYVAMMAIDAMRRSTLVVAPTLDLVRQWHGNLRASFGTDVGIVGGGEHRVEAITVTTYDSAYIHMEHLGARFGLVVYDEAHHLPGETYALGSRFCLAPYRLGLTATPERADGKEEALVRLIGPIVYRQEIVEMSGDYLADYETVHVDIQLSAQERAAYEEARGIYRAFVVSQGIRMSSPGGWGEFIRRSTFSEEGRRAMAAYRRQRSLAFANDSKLDYVAHLLHEHRADRSILFTQDNATAYGISRRFLIPVITHQTKITERSEILEGLASGKYRGVVTSKVLNEGVDVPDANVAIIVSGSGSVREHVQRLGRVLRKKGDKRATLYELVTANTSESYTSERRRDHVAYR